MPSSTEIVIIYEMSQVNHLFSQNILVHTCIKETKCYNLHLKKIYVNTENCISLNLSKEYWAFPLRTNYMPL